MTAAAIGYMPMPAGFPYADVFRRGRPKHGKPGRIYTYDAFYLRHPPMEISRRAKIFAPFDALKGFGEAVAAKEILYEAKRELSETEIEELDRRAGILQQLTAAGRSAGEKKRPVQVPVTITRYVPCRDPENDAFGKLGSYETITGYVLKTDPLNRRLVLDTGEIALDTVWRIEAEGIFDNKDDRDV